MPLLLLLILTLACLFDVWPEPLLLSLGAPADPLFYTALTWGGVGLLVAGAAALAQWTRRAITREPGRREAILHRYSSGRLYHLLALVGFYAVALFVLGWGWVVQLGCTVGSGKDAAMLPGAELLILAPFLGGLALSWVAFYDAEKALHDHAPLVISLRPFWTRGAYVAFHARQNLALVLAPLVLMLVQKGLQHAFPDEGTSRLAYYIAVGLMIGIFIAVLVSLPWLLRLVLGLTPLPAGPLRDRLEAACRRLHFRCSNILLWHTNGGVANAMVAGILPQIRYVLLTDRLISELTPDEIEAVFGHEVGHVRHRHMLYYLSFLLVSVVAVAWLWTLAADNVPGLQVFSGNDDWAKLPVVALVGAYIFVVFGFLSRRCERQADIFGCRTVSCVRADCDGHFGEATLALGGRALCPTGIRTFINALEKVAQLNHISRSRPGWLQSWQHSTIARRVDFLQAMLADPTLEPRFQRAVGLVKWGLVLGLGGVLLVLAAVQGWNSLLHQVL